jgi:hypothetical protein
MSSDCGGDKGDENREEALTPGGKRPIAQIHAVGPGKAVRRNPDGTYSVVPAEAPPEPGASERREETDPEH